MKHLFIATLLFVFSSNYAQVRKYVVKANRAAENNKMEKAKNYYTKALQLDQSNYNANVGLGIVLADYMGKPEGAIPFLEQAIKKSPSDTLYELIYILGKCYQKSGDYEKAIGCFNRMNGVVDLEEDDNLFQADLKNRKTDCLVALQYSRFYRGLSYKF